MAWFTAWSKKQNRMTEPRNYQAAMEELEGILAALQGQAVPMEILQEKIERAQVLLQFCRERLRSSEERLNDWLEKK